ncbi:EF-P lysine aminoacylase GenX [Leptospira perolatii]|uniref:EF-P lysine aminoacylase GenX n=1 Tax=Leptospira perolatii TaxID=2023191 RepID=A0A2M9ZPX8_9LEPT|nr:EF-P lysine aminoacylase EpmA [Leptospira perolatii]PJZ70775.1 EF-P lysine aminoacylase GenX [Leptospira perolatii]PJZ73983.1 EF-P lysine aminoacylase GenX [Leptospira perolatii]
MNLHSKETIIYRSKFLNAVRKYFCSKGFLEIDTPALKKIPSMEPHLNPFEVSSPSGNESGYLISSPEYSLKITLSAGIEKVYEIAHTFRSGELGSKVHTAEFLMLEFYECDADLSKMMNRTEDLIRSVAKELDILLDKRPFSRKPVKDLLKEYANCTWDREDLERRIVEQKLSSIPLSELLYEDCFYLVFLNLVEPSLQKEYQFIYDYPPEMAALARIENGVAKRFEMYFGNLEICNAFDELQDPREQRIRFEHEQRIRQTLGKKIFPIDMMFLEALERGIPNCSGNALGLDRLFLTLLGEDSLSQVSPYWKQL